jgi:hypothetical protein
MNQGLIMNQLNSFQPVVAGIFSNQQSISRILADLRVNNFQKDDIALVYGHQHDELLGMTHVNHILGSIERVLVVSVAMGGVLGLMLGSGINSFPGDIFTPAGPILSALAGIGIGTTIGIFYGLFVSFMQNGKIRRQFKSLIEDKGVIVSVHVNDRSEEILAKNVLVKDGALKVISPYGSKYF